MFSGLSKPVDIRSGPTSSKSFISTMRLGELMLSLTGSLSPKDKDAIALDSPWSVEKKELIHNIWAQQIWDSMVKSNKTKRTANKATVKITLIFFISHSFPFSILSLINNYILWILRLWDSNLIIITDDWRPYSENICQN